MQSKDRGTAAKSSTLAIEMNRQLKNKPQVNRGFTVGHDSARLVICVAGGRKKGRTREAQHRKNDSLLQLPHCNESFAGISLAAGSSNIAGL
jgi:hypothetical protein